MTYGKPHDRPVHELPCHYCGREVMPPFNADHADDCPSNTGIFPVEDRDVLCIGGCGCFVGLKCAECGVELNKGDSYAQLSVASSDGHVVTEMVCLMCAAIGVVT